MSQRKEEETFLFLLFIHLLSSEVVSQYQPDKHLAEIFFLNLFSGSLNSAFCFFIHVFFLHSGKVLENSKSGSL
jgi:hypothetical protein